MDGGVDEWMGRQMNKWVDRQKNGWTYGWIDG
jgi:hypothetical protein